MWFIRDHARKRDVAESSVVDRMRGSKGDTAGAIAILAACAFQGR